MHDAMNMIMAATPPLLLSMVISRNGPIKLGMKLPFLSASLDHMTLTCLPSISRMSPNLRMDRWTDRQTDKQQSIYHHHDSVLHHQPPLYKPLFIFVLHTPDEGVRRNVLCYHNTVEKIYSLVYECNSVNP